MLRQYLREPSCAAAEVENERDVSGVDMSRQQGPPKPDRLRRQGAGLVVSGGNLGVVVVHLVGDPIRTRNSAILGAENPRETRYLVATLPGRPAKPRRDPETPARRC